MNIEDIEMVSDPGINLPRRGNSKQMAIKNDEVSIESSFDHRIHMGFSNQESLPSRLAPNVIFSNIDSMRSLFHNEGGAKGGNITDPDKDEELGPPQRPLIQKSDNPAQIQKSQKKEQKPQATVKKIEKQPDNKKDQKPIENKKDLKPIDDKKDSKPIDDKKNLQPVDNPNLSKKVQPAAQKPPRKLPPPLICMKIDGEPLHDFKFSYIFTGLLLLFLLIDLIIQLSYLGQLDFKTNHLTTYAPWTQSSRNLKKLIGYGIQGPIDLTVVLQNQCQEDLVKLGDYSLAGEQRENRCYYKLKQDIAIKIATEAQMGQDVKMPIYLTQNVKYQEEFWIVFKTYQINEKFKWFNAIKQDQLVVKESWIGATKSCQNCQQKGRINFLTMQLHKLTGAIRNSVWEAQLSESPENIIEYDTISIDKDQIKLVFNTKDMKESIVKRFNLFNMIRNMGGFYVVMYGLLVTTYTILFSNPIKKQLAKLIYDQSVSLKSDENVPDLIKKRNEESLTLKQLAQDFHKSIEQPEDTLVSHYLSLIDSYKQIEYTFSLDRKQQILDSAILRQQRDITDLDGQLESIDAMISSIQDNSQKLNKEWIDEEKKENELQEREDKLSKEVKLLKVVYQNQDQEIKDLRAMLEQMKKRDEKPQNCGLTLAEGEIGYKCMTCKVNDNAIFCYECIKNSDHEGHQIVEEVSRGKAYCDCGEATYWDPLHFCELHGGPPYEQKQEIKPKIEQEMCGMPISIGDIAYRCKTCQMTDQSCVCQECFDKVNHEGHDYEKITNINGCCDCGDKSMWKQNGFCEDHGGQQQNQKLCGKGISIGDISYRCRTCQMTEKSCICKECFEKADHTDHDYEQTTSIIGCCDCGDKSMWKKPGFCQEHGGPVFQPKPKVEEKKVCGHNLVNGEKAYKCRTCQKKDSAVVCKKCFDKSDHQGHVIEEFTSDGRGFCDCGDPSFWDPMHFCEEHLGPKQNSSSVRMISLLREPLNPPDQRQDESYEEEEEAEGSEDMY